MAKDEVRRKTGREDPLDGKGRDEREGDSQTTLRLGLIGKWFLHPRQKVRGKDQCGNTECEVSAGWVGM